MLRPNRKVKSGIGFNSHFKASFLVTSAELLIRFFSEIQFFLVGPESWGRHHLES